DIDHAERLLPVWEVRVAKAIESAEAAVFVGCVIAEAVCPVKDASSMRMPDQHGRPEPHEVSPCGGAAVLRNAEAVRHEKLPQHDVPAVRLMPEAVICEFEVVGERFHGTGGFEVWCLFPGVTAVTIFVITLDEPALRSHGGELLEQPKC